jgi:ribosome-associated heat shock protein Hsp15
MSGARQRVDVWLYRARLTKTRAEAARLISEGGVRLVRDGQSRRLEKPSAEITPRDVLLLPRGGEVRGLRVLALGARRGPPAEALLLYVEQAPS